MKRTTSLIAAAAFFTPLAFADPVTDAPEIEEGAVESIYKADVEAADSTDMDVSGDVDVVEMTEDGVDQAVEDVPETTDDMEADGSGD